MANQMTILQWTPPQPPSGLGEGKCPYDHCTAETPFGKFLITWKSWNPCDLPTVDETPWGDWFGAFDDVEAAQQACEDEYRKRLQAALAQPSPEGELMELVAWLLDGGEDAAANGWDYQARQFGRAAELLQRQHPQPVPVSERLPEPGDWVWHCYAGVRFWQHGIYNGCQFFIGDGPESQPASHWLPAHVLPLPSGEAAQS